MGVTGLSPYELAATTYWGAMPCRWMGAEVGSVLVS